MLVFCLCRSWTQTNACYRRLLSRCQSHARAHAELAAHLRRFALYAATCSESDYRRAYKSSLSTYCRFRLVAQVEIAVVKVRGARGGRAQPPCSHLSPPPAIVWDPLIESTEMLSRPGSPRPRPRPETETETFAVLVTTSTHKQFSFIDIWILHCSKCNNAQEHRNRSVKQQISK